MQVALLHSPGLVGMQDDHVEQHGIGEHAVGVQELLQEGAQLLLVVHVAAHDHMVVAGRVGLVGVVELGARVHQVLDVAKLAR